MSKLTTTITNEGYKAAISNTKTNNGFNIILAEIDVYYGNIYRGRFKTSGVRISDNTLRLMSVISSTDAEWIYDEIRLVDDLSGQIFARIRRQDNGVIDTVSPYKKSHFMHQISFTTLKDGIVGLAETMSNQDSYATLMMHIDAEDAHEKLFKKKVHIVDCVADLRDHSIEVADVVAVKGYHKGSDIGGGLFVANPEDTTSKDDNGLTIVAKDNTRWYRQHEGIVSVEAFGVIGDGNTPTAKAFNEALKAAAGKVALSMPAKTFMIEAELKVPSNTKLSGAGIDATILQAHSTLPGISNIITNAGNNYKTRTGFEKNIHLEGFTVNADWKGRYKVGNQINNQGCGIKFSAVQDSVVERVRVNNAALHCFDVSADQYLPASGYTGVSNNPSRNVTIRDCIAYNPYRDDAFTSHNSYQIRFINCVAVHDGTYSELGDTQQGFELDEGSEDCLVESSSATGFYCGYQMKGHADTRPAHTSTIRDSIADGCVIGFMASTGGAPKGKDGFKNQVVKFENCIVRNPKKLADKDALAVWVYGSSGVYCDGLTVYGDARILIEEDSALVGLENIHFQDEVSTGKGLIEITRSNDRAHVYIKNLTSSATQSISAIYKNSWRNIINVDGVNVPGIGNACITLDGTDKDVIHGVVLSTYTHQLYFDNFSFGFTHQFYMNTYNDIQIQGGALDRKTKAPAGTVYSDRLNGRKFIQKNNVEPFNTWVEFTQEVGISSGYVEHGGTINPPEGFEGTDVHYSLFIENSNPQSIKWDVDEDGSFRHFRIVMNVDSKGKVTALLETNDERVRIPMRVRYTAIAIK